MGRPPLHVGKLAGVVQLMAERVDYGTDEQCQAEEIAEVTGIDKSHLRTKFFSII
jgi:hypothetical protein